MTRHKQPCRLPSWLLALATISSCLDQVSCRATLSSAAFATSSRRLQHASNSTLAGPSTQQQPLPPSLAPGNSTDSSGGKHSNSTAGFAGGAPGAATGGPAASETDCQPGEAAANCTGIPSPSTRSAAKQPPQASSPPPDAADAALSGPSDNASAMLLPSPTPEALPQASPEGYQPLPGELGRAYRPPPARAFKSPAPAPQGGGSGTPESGAPGSDIFPGGTPGPFADQPREGGSGGDGSSSSSKLQGWVVAVIAALAASLAVLAGVAGYYGVRKRRNRHKQFKRYISAHVARLSNSSSGGSGSDPLGKLPLSSWASHSLPFSSTGSTEAPASAFSPAGGLVAIELGLLHAAGSKQHLLGADSSCASAATAQADGGSGAWGAALLSHQQQGWGVGHIPAAYPAAPATIGAAADAVAASQLGLPAGDLWQGSQRQQLPGVVQAAADEATPMDEEGHPIQPSLDMPSTFHLGGPLLPGAIHCSLGSPPHPATPSCSQQECGQQEAPSGSQSVDEPEPMELESLGGPVLATNPWAGLLPQQASHAQQHPQHGAQHGQQHSQQQGQLAVWPPPQPAPQQQLGLAATEVLAAPAGAAATPAGPALEWSYFWDAASGASKAATAAAAGPSVQPQSALQQPLSLSPVQRPPRLQLSGSSREDSAESGADSDATSPLRQRGKGGFGLLSGSSGPSGSGRHQRATVTGKDEGSGGGSGKAAAASGLSSALGECDWEINPDDIQICKRPDGTDWQLGAGAFGKVYKALRDGVSEVAVKVLLTDASEDEDFRREVAILRSCRDSHVVQFLGACLQPERTMLVTEFMGGGDLRAALSRHPGAFRWGAGGRGRALALDIARGLHYLHARRIVHFDLKSNNILLSHDGSLAKIADVGLAAVVSHKYVSLAGLRGAFAWAAPEVLTGERHCSEKADIYSLGVVLWELVTCDVPQRGRMREPRISEECSAEVALLIDRCLAINPASRPSAKEVFLAIQASPKTVAPARS